MSFEKFTHRKPKRPKKKYNPTRQEKRRIKRGGY